MFKSYISVALRNLIKNRLYNIINIGGLSVGLSACIMILLFVNHELSYDQWIPEKERVFRAEALTRFQGAPEGTTDSIPPVVGPIMAEQLSEIEESVRFVWQNVAVAADNQAFEQDVTLTDPAVFDVFDVKLIEGDRRTALSQPDSIILSESEALRILGPGPALGKIVRVNGEFTFKVSGVMRDWPVLSDLDVNAFVPFSSPIIDDQPWLRENWGSFSGNTYVRVKEGFTADDVAAALNTLAPRVGPDWAFKDREDQGLPPVIEFYFTPATNAHLESNFNSGSRGSIEALWSAGIVAALILGIAVMNATNLGTMLALKRVREVAIRKALGANSRNLVFQILIESVILSAVAMLLGLVLVELLLPTFAALMERPLTTAPLYQPIVLMPLTIFTLFTGTISGLYPALVAAKFRPIDHLNGIAPTIGIRFRNALMILQFAATIGLLITCFVVFQQAKYAENRDPGFDSAQLVDIAGIQRPIVLEREQALRDALSRIPGVEAVAASHIAPGDNYNNFDSGIVDGGPTVNIRRVAVSEDFFKTMNIQPMFGRVFSQDRTSDRVVHTDNSMEAPVILNRQAITELGIDTPEDAVGRTLILNGDALPIIGVIEDLRTDSVSRLIRPSFFYIDPQQYRHIILRVSTQNLPSTLSAIDNTWRQQFPDIPVQRQFMDDAFAEYYEAARRRGQLLLGSALVMIVIASTGLFALSALTTERRAQEIGIRKVLGARTRNIVNLLLWQFSKPIIIANLIAWPVVWFVMQGWLQGFTDRIALTPIPFIGAGLLVLLIASATIVGQVIFLAMTNPAKILRYE